MFRFRQLALVAAVGLTLSVGLNTIQAQASINDGQDIVIYHCPNPPITNGGFESGLNAWDWEFNAENWGMGLADGYVDVVADPSSEPDILPAPSVPEDDEGASIGQGGTGFSTAESGPESSSNEYPGDSAAAELAFPAVGQVLLMKSTASSQSAITLSVGSAVNSRLSAGQAFTYCQGDVLRARALVGFGMTFSSESSAGFAVTMHLDNLTTGATSSVKLESYQVDWPCTSPVSLRGNAGWKEYSLDIAGLGAVESDELEAWFSVDIQAESQVTGHFPAVVASAMIDNVRITEGGASIQQNQQLNDSGSVLADFSNSTGSNSDLSVQYAPGLSLAEDDQIMGFGNQNGSVEDTDTSGITAPSEPGFSTADGENTAGYSNDNGATTTPDLSGLTGSTEPGFSTAEGDDLAGYSNSNGAATTPDLSGLSGPTGPSFSPADDVLIHDSGIGGEQLIDCSVLPPGPTGLHEADFGAAFSVNEDVQVPDQIQAG